MTGLKISFCLYNLLGVAYRMQVVCHYVMVAVVNCFSLLGVSSKSRLYGSFVDMFFLAVTFPGACMGLHQKHRGVKTGGMASVGGDFSRVLVFCNWHEFFHSFCSPRS